MTLRRDTRTIGSGIGTTPAGGAEGDVIEQYQAFSIEKRGIAHVPLGERPNEPRNLFWLWAAAIFNVTYLIDGALAIVFGLSLLQAIIIIIIGNLSWVLVGAFSLQGPKAGTATWAINRAPYGPNGARGMSVLNWLTVVGYEVLVSVTAVLAGLALLDKAGVDTGTSVKILVVIGVGALQTVLPIFGHATLVRVMRTLVVPFLVLFFILMIFVVSKSGTHPLHQTGSWQDMTLVLALVISSAGLGWANMANDYSRYLPPDASPSRIVGAVSVGAGLPSTLLMILGAGTAILIRGATNPISGLNSVLPTWFLIIYLFAIIAQMLCSNALNLYSSGLTLQVLGIRIRRYYAILVDTAISIVLTIFVVLSSRFYKDFSDFLLFGIIWLTSWGGVFAVDCLMRRGKYDVDALFDMTSRGSYWGRHGMNYRGVVAQIVGIVAALMFANISGVYEGPLSSATGGADFSVFMGAGFGALAYLVLLKALPDPLPQVPERVLAVAEVPAGGDAARPLVATDRGEGRADG